MMDVATIEREALALKTADRAVLADRLLLTLEHEDEGRMERWGREAERRLDALERGDLHEVDGPQAVQAIRQRLG